MVIELRRLPLLTVVLTVLTTAVSVTGLVVPVVTAALERTPAALHGEVWRWVTSLLVQDGGVAGTVSNLVFLAVLGTAAEQVVDRRWMALSYLLAGLAGQLAGVLWQPVGAGNSVAVCGLAGVVAWSVAREAAPVWATSAVALWLGAMLATWWLPLFLVGVAGMVADRAAGGVRTRPGPVRVAVVVATGMVAILLAAVENIHGVALAVGLGLGALPGRVDKRAPSATE
ncbi:MAG: rhomboid family intramembrane serine protease [Pseudonocardia sp.]